MFLRKRTNRRITENAYNVLVPCMKNLVNSCLIDHTFFFFFCFDWLLHVASSVLRKAVQGNIIIGILPAVFNSPRFSSVLFSARGLNVCECTYRLQYNEMEFSSFVYIQTIRVINTHQRFHTKPFQRQTFI